MILEAIEKYIEAIRKTEEWGNIVGQMLVDTICLWSEKYKALNVVDREAKDLISIVEEVFPELTWRIDCPFGILLLPDVAERAKEALEKLKGKG